MSIEISIGRATSNLITGHMTPAKAVEDIRAGKWSKEIAALRAATGDKAATLKKSLPALLWSGKFTTRKNDGLVQHSGLLCADIDKVFGRLAELHDLACKDAHVVAAFASPSGTGIKTVFRVSVPTNARQHLQNFNAVRSHVVRNYGAKVDEAAKDVARLCFVSHDTAAFYHAEAVPLEVAPIVNVENIQNLLQINGTANGSRNNAAFELACKCRNLGQTPAHCVSIIKKCSPITHLSPVYWHFHWH